MARRRATRKYARRITAETAMRDHRPGRRPRPDEDQRRSRPARKVLGMLNNCAGGITPWGTWLTCEENFNGYFWGKRRRRPPGGAQRYKRYGVPGNWYAWGDYHDRFDVAQGAERGQPLRLGGRDRPARSRPRRRRSAPPSAASSTRARPNIVNKDGRFVVYQGDDERFDYVYKFVTEGTVDPQQPRRQSRPARRRHALRRRATTPTAPASGCRWCTARAR